MKFEGGPHIAVRIPPGKYDDTVHFYRDVLLMDVQEHPVDHPAIFRSHSVQFGNSVLRLDCIPDQKEVEIYLEIRYTGAENALQFLEANGIEVLPQPEQFPHSLHRIRDPAGVISLLKNL